MNNTFFFFFFPPEFHQKKTSEQAEDSSPNPSFSACDIRTQKRLAECFAKSFPQKNSFCKTESAFRLATLPEYLEGRTPKEKHTFFFQRKSHPRQIRNARSVFSFGVAEALRGSGGAIHSSSGLVSKKVRILYNEYRKTTSKHGVFATMFLREVERFESERGHLLSTAGRVIRAEKFS